MSPQDAFLDLLFLIPLVLLPGLAYLVVVSALPNRGDAAGSGRVQGRPRERVEPADPELAGAAGNPGNDDFML